MHRKTGFTLLELIVVIIILGILATLGLTQYTRMVERSRTAEAKTILGDMRKLAMAYYLQHNSFAGVAESDLNVGAAADLTLIPRTCRSSHYFYYRIDAAGTATNVGLRAWRCGAGGKEPQGNSSDYLNLEVRSDGADAWTGPLK